MDTLKIDIVSDVVCPWCVIGFRNLKKAMEELKSELDFEISWKPYELHPEIPQEGYDKKLYMQQKFGSAGGKSRYDEITKIGESLNFNFNFSKTERIPNTFMAHRLLWKSEEYNLQTELSEALFTAYFTDGLDIGSKEILAEISESLGMNKNEILNFLDSSEGGQETAGLEMNFIEKSIGAVPTYFINDKYIIQGGQEPETFVSFLRKIIQKENEANQ
ncbi:MAG TPA: DsbA family oxidoreductase [SAR86 cluster bacterium]|jgi:predicted DsbA family dithiol-disulfide isomerase|nr:DsbA family oxidoreductase [SAR86 cluster bacterium]HJM15782.1 DsbA family oxidoreductase [SAR86 cluster bacterium]